MHAIHQCLYRFSSVYINHHKVKLVEIVSSTIYTHAQILYCIRTHTGPDWVWLLSDVIVEELSVENIQTMEPD